jgi:hypothetical protein
MPSRRKGGGGTGPKRKILIGEEKRGENMEVLVENRKYKGQIDVGADENSQKGHT